MNNKIADDIPDPHHVDRILLRQSIVPADVQRPQDVGILRRRIGQLAASQFLKVDVSLRVGNLDSSTFGAGSADACAGSGSATETAGHCCSSSVAKSTL